MMEQPCGAFGLGEAAIDAGYLLEARAEVSSTNDVALRRAREGETSRLWIVARRQTSGRGRHGRVFISPSGNLHASLMLIDHCEAAKAPELGFVAGLALFDAAEASTGLGHPRLALKWPNDLLIDGKKCAGILLEGHRLRGGAFALIVGIGVNVAVVPPDVPRATMLSAFAPDATAERLFARLSDAFARRFSEWGEAPSFSDAHFAAWAERAHGMGTRVRVKLPRGDVVGVFRGLERGRLLLDTAAGLEKLDAGDLYVMDAGEASRGRHA
jgi:BirA family transcriptional regulator, biotin operon repressor / biotin---[acetyl-CoA-carboxylase] ligase